MDRDHQIKDVLSFIHSSGWLNLSLGLLCLVYAWYSLDVWYFIAAGFGILTGIFFLSAKRVSHDSN